MQTALGTALLVVKGHAAPDVETTYRRARHLCHSLGETANLPPVLLGLWRVYLTRSDIDSANDLTRELLDLLGKRDDPTLYVMAHYARGVTCFARGEPQLALEHLQLGIDRAAATRGEMALIPTAHDPGLGCRVFSGCVLWLLGRPEQSNMRACEAVEMATKLGHPITSAFVLTHAAQEALFRGNSEEVERYASAAANIATKQGFTTWRQLSLMLHGWALAKRGDRKEGMSQMKEALAGWRAGGALFQVPHQLDLLAEVDGRVEPGLETLREALDIAEQTGQTWWQAELHRRYGELLLRRTSSQTAEAESHFVQAIQVARQQQAGSLELRAATSLAKLRRDANEFDAARALLEPACAKFAAGVAGADLIEAKALLDELA